MSEEQIMNLPCERQVTKEDIIEEFEQYQDKKRVARVFCLSVSAVNKIVKEAGKN